MFDIGEKLVEKFEEDEDDTGEKDETATDAADDAEDTPEYASDIKADDGENIYRRDEKSDAQDPALLPNNKFEINGVTYETDDNGTVYKLNGEYLPDTEYFLDGKCYEQGLRELTDTEKQKLKEGGMTEENIKKCKIDDDGVVHLDTINSQMEGKEYPPGSGVKYEKQTVILPNGMNVEGVFPDFGDSKAFECSLPDDLLSASDAKQSAECMKQLSEAIEKNPDLASEFTDKQLSAIKEGSLKVPGYTWHHNEVTGKMELVKESTHALSRHTGGKSIWGGGKENR